MCHHPVVSIRGNLNQCERCTEDQLIRQFLITGAHSPAPQPHPPATRLLPRNRDLGPERHRPERYFTTKNRGNLDQPTHAYISEKVHLFTYLLLCFRTKQKWMDPGPATLCIYLRKGAFAQSYYIRLCHLILYNIVLYYIVLYSLT